MSDKRDIEKLLEQGAISAFDRRFGKWYFDQPNARMPKANVDDVMGIIALHNPDNGFTVAVYTFDSWDERAKLRLIRDWTCVAD
jgi:hypothetical protein